MILLWQKCTYPACTCNCKEEWVKLKKEQRVYQFIAGLNESYGGIRRNILMIKPLPDIDSVYLMLIHDEQQSELQTSIPSFTSESASFFAGAQKYPQKVNFDPRRPNTPNDVSNLFYKYCKKSEHLIGKCHRLHGYPQNFQFTKGKKGVASCVQGAESSPQSSSSGSPVSIPQPEGPLHGFSKEQHDHILTLFQQNKLQESGFCASVILQGHSLKRPLEVGKLSNGLYILQLNGSTIQNSTSIFDTDAAPLLTATTLNAEFLVHSFLLCFLLIAL